MKAVSKYLMIVGVILVLISTGVAVAQDVQPTEPTISEVELAARLATAEEIVADCTLPVPAVEGSPVNMGVYDDWTRTAACIEAFLVRGITYSAWPGSTTNPLQHFKANWRLVDVATNIVIKSALVDLNNNPISMGPPSKLFEYRHCGPAKDYALLLDVSARQITPSGEVGLVNRDHSWRFTMPATPCRLFLPLMYKAPPAISPCTTWTTRNYYQGKLLEVLTFAVSADGKLINEGALQNITYPDCLEVEIWKDGVMKAPSDSFRVYIQKWNGTSWVEISDITTRALDGAFRVCCVDIEWSTGLYRVVVQFKEGGMWCKNAKKLSDPPATLAEEIVASTGLDYMQAHELASQMMATYDLNDPAIDLRMLADQLFAEFVASQQQK